MVSAQCPLFEMDVRDVSADRSRASEGKLQLSETVDDTVP